MERFSVKKVVEQPFQKKGWKTFKESIASAVPSLKTHDHWDDEFIRDTLMKYSPDSAKENNQIMGR